MFSSAGFGAVAGSKAAKKERDGEKKAKEDPSA